MLPPNHSEFFNPNSKKKKKFSITVNNYEWADSFDISTLGMSGEATMKRKGSFDEEFNVIQKYDATLLNVGVLISTLSYPHGKTLSVKFVPRYMFVNSCSTPVVFAQDDKNSTKQYFVNPGESICYHFQDKKDKNNNIKIRAAKIIEKDNDSLMDYSDIPAQDWSSRFSIDD